MNELTCLNNNNVTPYADVDLSAMREFISQSGVLLPGEQMRYVRGDWLIGDDKRKASPTEPYTVNVLEILLGWTKLVDNVVVQRDVGRLADGFRVPPRERLGDEEMIGDDNDAWKPTTAVVMRNAGGNIFTFSSFSASARTPVAKLLDAFLRRCGKFPGEFPVVLLGSGTGHSRRHNTSYPIPLLKIVGWEPWDGKQVETTANKPPPGDGGATNAVALEDPAKSTEELMADEIPF
jgi:hypothetical protein